MTNVTKLVVRPRPRLMQCSSCGASATAGCDCGVAYVPAGQRAAEAVADNPDRSDRAIAAELGVGHATVSRQRNATVSRETVAAPRVGRDGKVRRMPSPSPPLTGDHQDELDKYIADGRVE